MRRLLMAVPVLLPLGGCAVYSEYWAKPGGSDAAFEAAASQCDSTALARFPPVTLGMPGYFTNRETYCTPTSGGPNCMIINPGYLPQAQSASDTNERPRSAAFAQCMVAGGWRPFDPWAVTPPAANAPDPALGQALTECETRFKGKPNTTTASATFNQCVTNRARELRGPRPPA